MLNEWLLHQLSDSAFPAGGFAHSGGLEAAWQAGTIPNCDSLEQWLRCQLNQAAHASVPLAHAAYREPERIVEWDEWCDATLNNHVANRASRAQGLAFLFAASRAFPEPALAELARRVRGQRIPGHFAPALGAACRALGVDAHAMIRLLLYLNLRGALSAAVRLGIAGPMEGQSLQWRLAGYAESLVIPASRVPLADAAQTAPLLEMLQGTQDRLYSRLFQS